MEDAAANHILQHTHMNYITHTNALLVKLAIALVVLVCAVVLTQSAHADRTSLRMDAGLNRTAPVQTGTPGTGATGSGGSNGGTSGESGVALQDPQDQTLNEAAAHDMLDEFLASGPDPRNFINETELADEAEEDVEDFNPPPVPVNVVTLLHLIISRFVTR